MGDLNPTGIIRDLSLLQDAPIDRQADLLILDEIQQCPRALTSLKCFAEEMPELAICAAGSLLGVHLGECSFPVGKVDEVRMFPLTFDEFLEADGSPVLQEAFAAIRELTPLSPVLHQRLLDEFKTYKGYYAENFVAQTFRAGNRADVVCWREGMAEVEFLTDVEGAAVPVEVKSGWVTQAKSLKSFADKYKPAFSAVFSGRNAGHDANLARHYYPLYLASKFPLPVDA